MNFPIVSYYNFTNPWIFVSWGYVLPLFSLDMIHPLLNP